MSTQKWGGHKERVNEGKLSFFFNSFMKIEE
jgi:hypothetical protein